MENLWRIYGEFMENLWRIYEEFMENLWRKEVANIILIIFTYMLIFFK